MNKLYTPFLLICFLQLNLLNAQVSFTNEGNLLGPATGSIEDCAVDMNGDFLDDIVRVVNAKIFIDYQKNDGTFDHVELTVGMQNLPTWSLCAGDIDNNGYNDLLFGGGSNVSFIYANGDGTDYTEDLHSEYIFSQRSTFADIDNDGHLDAFVCHDVDQSHPYRNDGNGNLSLDQTLIETVDQAGNYAAIWVDYDNDGDTDLYVTKCRQGAQPGEPERTNRLYRNNGDGSYSEVGAEANMDDNAQGWATVFEDFDNDGDFDAFIVNHDAQNRLMENNGDGTFTDVIENSGINPTDLGAWENASGDFNNDGFVDIFSELSKELYLGNGDMTFTGQDLLFNSGGIGDMNNDGFLDVITGHSLMINDGNDNNWVKVCTEGLVGNKNGIGSRVEIYGEWGIQIREIRAGQSFSPMSSLNAHFGIGTAGSIDSLIVKWPSGVKTKVDNPTINSTHIIPETNCLLAPSALTVNGSTSICPGEQVEIMAPAGFDNYQWSNNTTGQSIMVSEAGTFYVISSNNDGCVSLSNTVTISIIVDEDPEIILDGDDVICQGQSVTLTASSGTNHMWSNGMTGESIEVTEAGQYFVNADAICSSDALSSDTVEITVLDAIPPDVDDVVLPSPEEVTLTATTTGDSLEWYDMAIGGTLLGTGPTLYIPLVNQDTTFYVQSLTYHGGEEQDGGKPDNSGGGGIPNGGAYNYFDAFEPFTILRVTVYVPNGLAGVRTIQLFDKDNMLLDEKIIDIAEGQHDIELNFDVPVGEDFSLRCVENNLFRNDSGVQYPYPVGDVGSITTSFYGDDYYYYFYNWKIQKPIVECVSLRTAANVTVVVSSNELDNALSNISLFPNPASNQTFLHFKAKETTQMMLRVFDATGKEVIQKKEISTFIGENRIEINTSQFSKGIYNVQLSIDGNSISKKLVIQ